MAAFPEQRREQFLERPLPSSEESERAILGAVLLDNALIAQAVEHLKVDDFYSPLHRRIFGAMISLFESSKKIDPILIGEELKKDGVIESIAGGAAITNLNCPWRVTPMLSIVIGPCLILNSTLAPDPGLP